MKKRKTMAILGLLFIIVGTVLTAFATMKYRSVSESQRNQIQSLSKSNNEISKRNEELNKKIESTSIENISLSQKNHELNKVLDIKSDENQQLIRANLDIANKNTDLASSNIELTEKVNSLSESILDKSKKLQYPIVGQFYLNYTMSFIYEFDQDQLNDIEAVNSNVVTFTLDLNSTGDSSNINSDYDRKFPSYNIIINDLRSRFLKGDISIEFYDNRSNIVMSLSNKFNFVEKNSNQIIDWTLNTSFRFSYEKGLKRMYLDVRNLPVYMIKNHNKITSLLELKNLSLEVYSSKYNGLKSEKISSVLISHNKTSVMSASNFDFDYVEVTHTPQKVDFHLQ